MPTIFERATSRQTSVGPEHETVDLLYGVKGTEDDSVVRALVEATIPAFFQGLLFQEYRLEHLGGGVWDVVVTYARKEPKETGESTFSFDTSGGTQKITQSLQTVGKHAPPGEIAPDFHGAINVTSDSVEGVEITMPVYNWTETWYLPDSQVTPTYKANIFALTGRVNNAVFRGFARGEVLFLGASGSKRNMEDWEITFKFAASPNATNLLIDNITVPAKEGWHYLWVRYEDEEDAAAKSLIKRPRAVYVERVYEYGDFSLLGIGT
ncbi:MAG: hypothetical protein KatS3mg109_1680 [Pirellulaceae bacterium]|nr:MAG: hypothetical protein KatS3mg109_1680 [Pirellulaceae bacterium]